MNGMYLEDLVTTLSCGCSNPGCNKIAEWIHARCHKKSGLKVEFTDNIMSTSCYTCNAPIVPLFYDSMKMFKKIDLSSSEDTITFFFELPECPTPKCSLNMGLDVRYKDENIFLYCHTCKELVASVTVTKRGIIGG